MSEQQSSKKFETLTVNRDHNNEKVIESSDHQATIYDRSYKLVRLNAPSFFKDPDWLRWLNHEKDGPATWHPRGAQAGEYSDVFTVYAGARFADGQFEGEGSDYPNTEERPGIPDHIYQIIAKAVEAQTGSAENEALVWISNLE